MNDDDARDLVVSDPDRPDDEDTGDLDHVADDDELAASSEDVTTDADRPDPGPDRRRWLWLAAPWVVTVLAVAVAVVATVRWQALSSVERDAAGVERAAGEFLATLTNWDAVEGGMQDTREQLRAAGTPRFATDVDELFGTTGDLATLAELGARSEGEVRDVFVQSLSGDDAEVLAVAVQRVVTDVTAGAEVSMRFAQMQLVREDGTWLVDEVELLVDSLREGTVRTDDPDGAPGDVEGPLLETPEGP